MQNRAVAYGSEISARIIEEMLGPENEDAKGSNASVRGGVVVSGPRRGRSPQARPLCQCKASKAVG